MTQPQSFCNTCFSEDCLCVCYICNKHQLEKESTTSPRNLRQRKFCPNNVEWISCNTCNNWMHPQCTGLNKKEYNKLKNINILPKNKPKTKIEPFLKCIKCCLKTLLKTRNTFEILNQFSQDINKSSKAQNKHCSKPEPNQAENFQNIEFEIEKANQQEINTTHCPTEKTSKNTANSATQTCNTVPNKTLEAENTLIPKTKKETLEKSTSTSADQNSFQTNSTGHRNKSNTNTILPEKPQQLNTTNTANNQKTKYIRIIDNITDSHPLSSSDIKKNIINKIGKSITIKYTYTLPKGGLAIHLSTEEDVATLEEEIAKIYPNSVCRKPTSSELEQKIVIKNINPYYYTRDIAQYIKKKYSEQNIKVRRFHSSTTRFPLPIICITSTKPLTDNLLKEGILIFGNRYNCQTYKKPTVRCYNCQSFGHIAKFCQKRRCCQTCGLDHPHNNICDQPQYCINCNKPGHPSNSRTCPTYLALIKQINQQHETSSTKHLLA